MVSGVGRQCRPYRDGTDRPARLASDVEEPAEPAFPSRRARGAPVARHLGLAALRRAPRACIGAWPLRPRPDGARKLDGACPAGLAPADLVDRAPGSPARTGSFR